MIEGSDIPNFSDLLGDWKYEAPEPKVLREYAGGAVKVLGGTRLGSTDEPASTTITTEHGTVTVNKISGFSLPGVTPDYAIGLHAEGVHELLGAKRAPTSGFFYAIYDGGEYIGTAGGPRLDLALARALGVEDEALEKDAADSIVDSKVAVRIKSTLVFGYTSHR